MLSPAALLLADARLPTGAHAHSAGVEHAVSVGRVRDLETLHAYAVGRLHTTGLCDAALAAATAAAVRRCTPSGLAAAAVPWAELDAEAAARLPSPALRAASRQLGRQLLRAADRVWGSPILSAARAALPDGPQQSVALGATAAAAGLEPADAALCCAYHTVTSVTSAGLRLLGLDPYACAAAVAALSEPMKAIAAAAAAAADGPLAELPCASAVAADIAAEVHARWEVRLFVS